MKRRTLFVLLLCLGWWRMPWAEASSSDLGAELERAGQEFEQAQDIKASDPARSRQLLGSAVQRFESLIAAGVRNGYLEYNLGNTFFQLGDVGRAILHYRRAERLIPRDPLLAENLRAARSRSLLNIAPARSSAVYRGLFFWHYQTSPRGRFVAAVSGYVLGWVLLAAWFLTRRGGLRPAFVVALIVFVASAGSLAVQFWQDRTNPDAVVVAGDVEVYKGPAASYQKQFEQALQPGVEVTVVEERGDWRRIELSDGGSGWVAREAVELVPPREGNQEVSLLRS